ncbi:hypothetical protein [Microbacterium sp. LWS13-1.2]|uniref:Uncharacterized protein n=1 Tax=Microbacterium sp. LWS13-1.2 TaxID=3135264 RepID=A0AAU6S7J5_9MICO
MKRAFDDLARKLMTANRRLSLITDDPFVVLDEEREALRRVVALTQEWALEDARRRQ